MASAGVWFIGAFFIIILAIIIGFLLSRRRDKKIQSGVEVADFADPRNRPERGDEYAKKETSRRESGDQRTEGVEGREPYTEGESPPTRTVQEPGERTSIPIQSTEPSDENGDPAELHSPPAF